MNNSKQNQESTKPSTKVIVGQKIWAVVNILAGDVKDPELQSEMSTDSKAKLLVIHHDE